MSAQHLHRENKEGIYSHIYNKGVEKRTIFNDEEDYEVFLGYLKDYLAPPQDPESIKKSFTVHGRKFRGTPHQPKNYFNKVELIAYSLKPDHFHVLLHQMTRGSLESFLRSLCTRYSMYFNKKYQRAGALFEGPYKSVQVEDKFRLLYLTRYFHCAGGYSSYAEYLGSRSTSWVKPKVVQSFFDKVKNKADSYKDFVEKHQFDQKEKEFLEGITFEDRNQHLEMRDLARNSENDLPKYPAESSEKIYVDSNLKPLQRIPEFLVTAVVFLVLLTFGIRNIMVSATERANPSTLGTSTVVSPTEIPKPSPGPSVLSPTEEIQPAILLTIEINDASESATVNIRQKPTTDSEKIGKAKDGDTFEFVSIDSGWYEVKLADGSTGFISATYIKKDGANN